MPRNYLFKIVLVLSIAVNFSCQNVEDVIEKRVKVLISLPYVPYKKFILQKNHKPLELSELNKAKLANLADLEKFNEILDNILVERVVGTESHDQVKDYIVKELKDLNWDVQLDEFEDETPFGQKNFANIIGYLNPNAERYLLLACHYDSKYFDEKDKKFLGATGGCKKSEGFLKLI